HLMASHLDIPVINAGDGMHEHPTQALLDAYTILRHKKKLDGLQVTIVGDIYHSRVARSAIHLLSKCGARITLCGPPELLPEVANCPQSVIVEEVKNGVPVRMAVLARAIGRAS